MIRSLARAAVLGLAMTTALVSVAEAAGVLTIGRREDGTTFDPIASAQNIDFWVFSNVFDVLVPILTRLAPLDAVLADGATSVERTARAIGRALALGQSLATTRPRENLR